MKNLKNFEELNEGKLNEIKFVKTAAGVVPANKKDAPKEEVKVGKDTWVSMYSKFNKMSNAKRAEVVKALTKLGLM